MTDLTFTEQDNLALILERITQEDSTELNIILETNSEATQSPINEEIIRYWAAKQGKTVQVRSSQDPSPGTDPTPSSPATTLSAVKERLTRQPEKSARNLKQKKRFTPLRIFLISTAGFAAFFLSAIAFVYYYLPRATVTLYVQESELNQQESVTVDPQIAEVDYNNLKIPGTAVEAQDTQSREFKATGEKITGEKATGNITLVNMTPAAVSLKIGTVVSHTTEAGTTLSFTLLEEATIAPRDEVFLDRGVQYNWGITENISVIATEIGEAFNLPQTTSFGVDSYTTDKVTAVSENDFTGGLTTKLTIVTAADQNQARDELAAQISTKNAENLRNNLDENQQLLTETVMDRILESSYSHQVESETEEFTATISVKSSATTFDRSNIEALLMKNLTANIPQGFTLPNNDSTVTVEAINVSEKGKISLIGTIRATVIPQINQEEIKTSLKSLNPSQAETYIRNLERISGYKVDLWPQLPSLLQRLPHRISRITIKIEVKQE
ncbi:hypothetical protein KJ596_02550 [Patescibacteria group bacterium]|nr:hypothetical protein [Patescibacteria group bacterium]MBU1868671.1 hypothetical protein [Patescibacteria group bacterium]